MTVLRTIKNKIVCLLNPAEKSRKYAYELKNNVAMTNDGVCKTNSDGACKKLTKQQRAFRAGYLSARKDSAKAYNSTKKKYYR